MFPRTDDVRITHIRPLIPPAILMEELPVSVPAEQRIADARTTVANILHGRDDRLLVVTGPCSIHDPKAGLEYAERLVDPVPTATDETEASRIEEGCRVILAPSGSEAVAP